MGSLLRNIFVCVVMSLGLNVFSGVSVASATPMPALTPHQGSNAFQLAATGPVKNVSQVRSSVTLDVVSLTLLTPAMNAMLDSDQTLVTGTFQAPPNSGISVNGVRRN